jgi:hypothetical protein
MERPLRNSRIRMPKISPIAPRPINIKPNKIKPIYILVPLADSLPIVKAIPSASMAAPAKNIPNPRLRWTARKDLPQAVHTPSTTEPEQTLHFRAPNSAEGS